MSAGEFCKVGMSGLLILALLLQVACETGESNSAVYNDLVLRFESNRTRAEAGKPVHMRFSVKNGGSQPIVIDSKNLPVMDIVVIPQFGQEILLSWSAQNPDKVAHRLEWKPGESKIIELVWTPKQEDIYIGAVRIIYLAGYLYENSRFAQSADVMLCASNVCR